MPAVAEYLAELKRHLNKGEGKTGPVLYHPFDASWTYYSGKTKGFIAYPKSPLMRSALSPNLLLLTIRNARRGNVDSFFVANTIVDKDGVSPFDNATFFPLYLYPESGGELFGSAGPRPNFTPAFVKAVEEKLGMKMDVAAALGPRKRAPSRAATDLKPEDIFHHAYAIFHSLTYRSRYDEFLKIDFPRLPLTADKKLFFKLAGLGAELVSLHVMESPKLNDVITKFPKKGNNVVEKVSFAGGRVHINDAQFFDGVTENVWNFHIGGYQVCEKWLKDRKGRTLLYEDLQHYQKIVVALSETIRLMDDIDRTIPGWPMA